MATQENVKTATPGPWQQSPNFPHGMTAIIDSDGATKPYTLVANAIREADAKLIAAAPRMMEALHRLINGPRSEADWLEAEAALYDARGYIAPEDKE